MAKVLIKRQKKEFIKELGKTITTVKGKKYFVADTSKDYHTSEGIIKKKDLAKKDGSLIKSSTGKEFHIFTADFLDMSKKIKRLPQTMPIKDIAHIIACTGIDKESIVVDAGAGSGATAAALARLCKKVTTYEINKDYIETIKKNFEFLGLKNITLKEKDITKGISEKNVDLITLDMPNSEKVIEHAEKALKVGGYLVAYTIQASQLQIFCNELSKNKSFLILKSCELIERLWKVEGKILRPHTIEIGHSGFITFARKIC